MLNYSNNGHKEKVTVHDSSATKEYNSILGSNGQAVSNPKGQRKELVENLLQLLQNSVDTKLSGQQFTSKVDMLENHLFETTTYIDSLKEACETITTSFPTDKDEPLTELVTLCETTKEGIDMVRPYLDAIKIFSEDLNNIKSDIYTQITTLFQEV